MTDTTRDLIQRMADELDHYRQLLMDDRSEVHALATEARAALAEPEPEEPTDEKWYSRFADWLEGEMPEGTVIGDPLWWASKIADYLARWGRPAVEPESEGPTDEDLDELFTEIDQSGESESWRPFARTVLARWGNHSGSPDTSNQTSQSPSPMQSLDQHNQQALGMFPLNTQPRPNGIACPECQHELMDSNPSVSLTSWPPQYSVHCPSCGYTGSRY